MGKKKEIMVELHHDIEEIIAFQKNLIDMYKERETPPGFLEMNEDILTLLKVASQIDRFSWDVNGN